MPIGHLGKSRRYGTKHRKRREQWRRLVDAGSALCVRCGRPIIPATQWHLDHADDGNGYLGASHAYCNAAAAGRLGRQRQLGRPAIRRITLSPQTGPRPRFSRNKLKGEGAPP